MPHTPNSPKQSKRFPFESLRHAFEIGREMYRMNQRRELRRKVLAGWDDSTEQIVKRDESRLDEIVRDVVVSRYNQCGRKNSLTAASLGIGRTRLVGMLNRFKVAATLLVLAMFSTALHAQRGTLSFVSAVASPVTNKQMFLMWDNPAGASNRVEWGMARNFWTNSTVVTTNRFPVTNGWHYCVKSVIGGIESIPALWPSNRIGELWLRGMGTNLTGGTNIQKLCSFTNQPPGQMQFWGVANITTGWE